MANENNGSFQWPQYWDAERLEQAEILKELAQQVNAQKLFQMCLANSALHAMSLHSETEVGPVTAVIETLAFCLSPFWISDSGAATELHHIVSAWTAAEKIVNAFSRDKVSSLKEKSSIASTGFPKGWAVQAVHNHGAVVRSSAYPEQTRVLVEEVLGRYEAQLAATLGIGPKRSVAVLWAVTDAVSDNIKPVVEAAWLHSSTVQEEWKASRTAQMRSRNTPRLASLRHFKTKSDAGEWAFSSHYLEHAPNFVPASFEDVQNRVSPPLQKEEWTAFIKLFGFSSELRPNVHHLEEMRKWPIFVFENGHVQLIDMGHASDRIWEVFDEAARRPPLENRYQKSRSQWLEAKTGEYLKRIFGSKNVMESALYADPDQPGGEAELDFLVSWGPFLVFVECKAKQFRLEAQLRRSPDGRFGDAGRLNSDLRNNIHDAFEQAERAMRAVNDGSSTVFREKATGRTLEVTKTHWTRLYPLTVSLLGLGSIANVPSALREIGLFAEGRFPLALQIAELDIISQHCNGGDVFLHFIERRIRFLEENLDIIGDELDVFGAYLGMRLHDDYLGRKEKTAAVVLVGFSDIFSHQKNFERGYLEEAPGIRLQVPDEIQRLLRELRVRGDDMSRWIAFALLGLSDVDLAILARLLREAQTQVPPDGIYSLMHRSGDLLCCIVASRRHSDTELAEHLQLRMMIDQYQSRAPRCLGIGLWLIDPIRPFHTGIWGEGEWQYNEELEKAIAGMPKRPIAHGKAPPPNAPCWCGSSKKYKRCCGKSH